MPHAFPLILGNDAAGVVEETGQGVSRFRPGDRVFGQVMNLPRGQGSYAGYAVAGEDGHLSLIPDGLSFTLAAALPTASMAAYNAIEAVPLAQAPAALATARAGHARGKTVIIPDEGA